MREAIVEFEESDDEGDEVGILQTELNELAKLELNALELDDDDIQRNQIKFTKGFSLRQPKTWYISLKTFKIITFNKVDSSSDLWLNSCYWNDRYWCCSVKLVYNKR